MALLEIRNVTRRYGTLAAVNAPNMPNGVTELRNGVRTAERAERGHTRNGVTRERGHSRERGQVLTSRL